PAEPADRMARRIDSPQHADSITAARAVPPRERLDDSRRSVDGAGRLPEQGSWNDQKRSAGIDRGRNEAFDSDDLQPVRRVQPPANAGLGNECVAHAG